MGSTLVAAASGSDLPPKRFGKSRAPPTRDRPQCQGGIGSSPPAAALRVGGRRAGDIALRRQLAASFTKAHPGIKVEILVIPATSYDQKVQTMIAGGNPPDIFGSGDVQIPNIVQKNFAVDLKPYVSRDSYDISDFYPQVIDGLTYNNKLVGLTDNWDTQVMYYKRVAVR